MPQTRSQRKQVAREEADELPAKSTKTSSDESIDTKPAGRTKRPCLASASSHASRPQKGKKARFQKSQPTQQASRYKLRSATTTPDDEAEAKAPPAVTPGSVSRQIRFDSSNTPSLPEDVVDIFATSTQECCFVNYPRTEKDSMQLLANAHFASYGAEFDKITKLRENNEYSLEKETERYNEMDEGSLQIQLKSEGPLDRADDDNVENDDGQDDQSLALSVSTRSPESADDGTRRVQKNSESLHLPNQPLLTAKNRRTLVTWLSEVATEYKLSDAAYHLAVTLLDLLLDAGPTKEELERIQQRRLEDFVSDDEDATSDQKFIVMRSNFQGVGCACLLIASKIEDMTPPRIEDLVYISDYAFSSQKLIELESRICKQLNFRLYRVTPMHFLDLTLRASQATAAGPSDDGHIHWANNLQMLFMTLYLLQLARGNIRLVGVRPSVITAAAVYLARATLGIRESDGSLWSPTLRHFTGYNVSMFDRIVFCLYQEQLAAENSSAGTHPAFKKFRTETHLRVSLTTVPRPEDLGTSEAVTGFDYDRMDVADESHAIQLTAV